LQYIPAPWTIYHNVNSLEPGTYACFKGGKLTRHTYFRPEFSSHATGEEKQHMRAALTQAVKRQLMSEVPLGFFLSGGVDSALVAYTAAALLKTPIKTFTAIIQNEALNEQKYAERVARDIKSEHFELPIPDCNLADIKNIVPRYGQPFADTSLLPTFHISRLIKQHVTVALGGDGADELFCGYDRYYSAAQTTLPPSTYFNQSYFRVSEEFKNQFIQTQHRQIPTYEFLFNHLNLDSQLPLPTIMRHLDLRFFLEGDILAKVDISSMAHSVEARVPFLDRDIIQLAFTLPETALRDATTNKKIIKELLLQYLPPSLVFRQKIGFMLPVDDWIGPVIHALRDNWNHSALRELNYFKESALEQLWAQTNHTFESAYFIFGLFCLDSWLAHNTDAL
jgi:asparagine synthase (glutamine-hydrolysing)